MTRNTNLPKVRFGVIIDPKRDGYGLKSMIPTFRPDLVSGYIYTYDRTYNRYMPVIGRYWDYLTFKEVWYELAGQWDRLADDWAHRYPLVRKYYEGKYRRAMRKVGVRS